MDYKENKPAILEVGTIFQQYEEELLASKKLCITQKKTVRDIIDCRTQRKKGHLSKCTNCGHVEQSYNSCRNRNCNKCQYVKQQMWADKLKGKLPPGKYFHVVFTIPESLNKIFYLNQHDCYGLLFNAAWSALNDLCKQPRFLGAQIGAVGVLHTWSSTLNYHPHLHFLVPSGGIDEDLMEWIRPQNDFLLPVKVLSKVFRGKMMQGLMKMIDRSSIEIPNDDSKENLISTNYYPD